ncbi:hypothetical protein T484DRAFT_3631186 [Baffinella frigidus]|nr:hypothetical protein T484DRAFT_3631186 [Cryptophyta sp. CCMP2293]
MGTPAHFVLAMSLPVVFMALLVCDFLYTLHSEHSTARQRLLDDTWLLQRCGEPDFYTRLKQHTALCEGVETNARHSILLHSSNEALRNAQLCGFDSCTNIARAAVAILFTVPIVMTLLYSRLMTLSRFINSRFINSVLEQHLLAKYNNPTYQTRLIGCSGARQVPFMPVPAHRLRMHHMRHLLPCPERSAPPRVPAETPLLRNGCGKPPPTTQNPLRRNLGLAETRRDPVAT